MTEPTTQYQTNNEMAVNVSFTLSMTQVAKLSDLHNRLGMNKSYLVRQAIDDLFAKLNAIEEETNKEIAA